MALEVKAVSLVQGSREFHVKAVELITIGPLENDEPPLVEPSDDSGTAIILM